MKSNVIQLHGLPIGTTTAPIRRFFSGLDPRRIMILLPNNKRRNNVPDLDARHDIPPRKTAGLRVERYDSTNLLLRVLVKFESAPTAALAVQRSGEIMQLQQDKAQGAAVAVTQLNKAKATFLCKNLAVDAVKGEPLHQTVQNIASKLDSAVSNILWDAAIRELRLLNATTTLDVTQNNNNNNDDGPVVLRPLAFSRPRNPRDHEQERLQELQEYRNKLQQEYNRVQQQQTPHSRLAALDPALLQLDPVVGITANSRNVLQHEMDRVEHATTVARRWKLLVATRSPNKNGPSLPVVDSFL